jgi:predicted nucleic acid-binding protein
MILVDTSVLIDALKGKDTRLPLMFAAHPAAICGVTVAEVLHGARDADDFKKLEAALAKFPKIAVDDSIWQPLTHNLFLLRTHGVAVPFQDTLLATVALQNDIELWTRDKQFQHIQKVLPALKLFEESEKEEKGDAGAGATEK